MCRSVPQIAVFSILISTSLGPTSGTGTSSIQMPCSGLTLTKAFIICGMGLPWGERENANYRWPGVTPLSCTAALPAWRSGIMFVNSCARLQGSDGSAGKTSGYPLPWSRAWPSAEQLLKQLREVIEEVGKDDRPSAHRFAFQLPSLKNHIERLSDDVD